MSIFRCLLFPLSLLYCVIVELRNLFFNAKIFSTTKFSVPIVSVGNISAGGSGKTPYILKLIELLKQDGKVPAVILRGYRRKSNKSFDRVNVGEDHRLYGDEASLIAFRHPDIPVYVGANRVNVAKELLKNENVDCILLDDAFQHRWIARDVDLVIIDVSDPSWYYRLLPFGRLREPLKNIGRATHIAFHKVNFVNEIPSYLAGIEADIQSQIHTLGLVKLKDWATGNLVPVQDATSLDIAKGNPAKQQDYAVLCAVAKPQQVLQTIKLLLPNANLQLFSFSDHYDYRLEDLPDQKIITTEKDAIKLLHLKTDRDDIYVIVNDLAWKDIKGNIESDEQIRRKLFPWKS